MDAPLLDTGGADDTTQRIPQLAGFMDKKGEHFRAAFKRRWFCLDGDELRWSDTTSSAAKGSVRLAGDCSARMSKNPEGTRAEIELVTSSRRFRLRCENAEAAERWIQGLNQAAEQLRKHTTCVSEAVPPEAGMVQVESYLSLVTACSQSAGVWPPKRPFATPVETAQRRLAFGVSLCAYSQPLGRTSSAESMLERVDADVLDCIGKQLAMLALISPLEQALQAVALAQEASIVARHLTDLVTDPGVRANMEMFGAMWMKRGNTKGAFKGRWKALVCDVAESRGLAVQATLGQLAVRRDADDAEWGVGYVTQIAPLHVNAASVGESSPGYEWGEVRTVVSEGGETKMEVGERVVFRDDTVWGVGLVTQLEPLLHVNSSSSDVTSAGVPRDEVWKFPAKNQGVENLFLELNSRMESLPTTAALLSAAESTDAQLIRMLAENGADPDGLDHNGQTALHVLAGAHEAKQPQHSASVAALLNAGPSVDMKVTTTGQTALMRAVYRGYACMCVQLLRAGADAALKDMHGQDAKQWAAKDMPPHCTLAAQAALEAAAARRSHIDHTAAKVVVAVSHRTVGKHGRRIYGQREAPADTPVLTIQPDGSLRNPLHAVQVEDPLAAKRLAKEQCLQALAGAKRTAELRARRRGHVAKLKAETKQEAQVYLKGQLAQIKQQLQKIQQREDEILAAASSATDLDELGPEPEPER